MANSERDPAPAVTRALRILTALAESESGPMTLSELARAVDIAKSSAANLCAALEAGGMIERAASGYRLGRRTAELGGAFALQFNQVREFYAVCEASPVLSHEVVQIAMLDETEALYLARHEGRGRDRFGTPLGSRLPAAQCATGRAALMFETDEQIRERFRGARVAGPTEYSIDSIDALLVVVEEARARGYAVDPGAAMSGITGVAVPLAPWAPGEPVLAMGVAVRAGESDEERITMVGEALLEAAAALTNPFTQPSRRID